MKISIALILLVAHAAPPGPVSDLKHRGAEAAMARIVLVQDFGAKLRLVSRDVVTFADNPEVPGLNGLLFMRWKGDDPSTEVTASVQWFADSQDLLSFYRSEKERTAQGLQTVGDTVIWKTSDNSYLWTDGAHFVVGIGGNPKPPRAMLTAWLELVESVPPDLARAPGESP